MHLDESFGVGRKVGQTEGRPFLKRCKGATKAIRQRRAWKRIKRVSERPKRTVPNIIVIWGISIKRSFLEASESIALNSPRSIFLWLGSGEARCRLKKLHLVHALFRVYFLWASGRWGFEWFLFLFPPSFERRHRIYTIAIAHTHLCVLSSLSSSVDPWADLSVSD